MDIVFVRADGTIGKIVSNLQPGDLRHWSYPRTAAVIELVGGFCQAHGLREGDRVAYGKVARTAELAKRAQLEPGQAMCRSCGWFGPRDEFVDVSGYEIGDDGGMDGLPTAACPDCGSGSIKFARVAEKTHAECYECGYAGPKQEFGSEVGPPFPCPKCGSEQIQWLAGMPGPGEAVEMDPAVMQFMRRMSAGTFDGTTTCSSCGSTPPAGDWMGASGECEACAERRDGSHCGQALTVPSVPSAKPAEQGGDQPSSTWKEPKQSNGEECDACGKPAPGLLTPITTDVHEPPGGEPGAAVQQFLCPTCLAAHQARAARIRVVPLTADNEDEFLAAMGLQARDPEEDESREMPPACAKCGARDPDWYEVAGVGMVCGRCADELVDSQEHEADGISHDPLRSLTEASRRAQQDEVRCPACDEPVGPRGLVPVVWRELRRVRADVGVRGAAETAGRLSSQVSRDLPGLLALHRRRRDDQLVEGVGRVAPIVRTFIEQRSTKRWWGVSSS